MVIIYYINGIYDYYIRHIHIKPNKKSISHTCKKEDANFWDQLLLKQLLSSLRVFDPQQMAFKGPRIELGAALQRIFQ